MAAVAGACAGKEGGSPGRKASAPGAPERGATAASDPGCPQLRQAGSPLPGVQPAQRTLGYWLEVLGARHDLDEVLLSPMDIRNLNASARVPREGFYGQRDLLEPDLTSGMAARVEGRLAWLRGKLDGEYQPSDAVRAALAVPDDLSIAASLRVALDTVQIYCAPSTAILLENDAVDERIDRNRCSALRPQEPVLVMARWPGDLLLVQGALGWGWIAADAPLSPEVPAALAATIVRGPFGFVAGHALDSGEQPLPPGTRVPLARPDARAVHVATASGFRVIDADGERVRTAQRPLTRRAVLEAAFGFLDTAYGFGGAGGGIDCSRFLVNLFETFGIALPRHSAWQARAGSFWIDTRELDVAGTERLMDLGARRGVVLLEMKGHIMLYLGRDADGRPMAIHSLGHYLEPCDGGGETTVVVDRVAVSDLSLGAGTSKTSLVERIERIAVLGGVPGVELAGVAVRRPPAPVQPPSARACRKVSSARVFVSPERPHRGAPLRVVATAAEDPGAASITLFDPDGVAHTPEVVTTGGPPFGFIATVDSPRSGRWTAVLGDGEDLRACRQFTVHSRPKAEPGDGSGPVWAIERQWGPITEDLFAVFVERLFDYPVDEDLTWPNLHAVTRDRDRNILIDHLGLNEDRTLEMVPDCADLPYTLRAYFAWKLGLPYGFHECRRAREGRPPRCHREADNLLSRAELGAGDHVSAFDRFVNGMVRNSVHSSSGRTSPRDDDTDFYPVPLTREALRPGTLFTDPYGHLLVVADWVPQGASGYGALIGADAQPDGTVGRRRFWRGSFLFHPETHSGGAGFKAFRPWVYDKDGQVLSIADNKALRRSDPAFSLQQYKGSASDFYDRMQSLINPRALDPVANMVSLVDALEEQVSRRGTSVANGEAFMRERGYREIDMPQGSGIFLTTGPWEDYSTPSRDWRLLIAIDTVVEFPAAVERSPGQYGIAEDEVAEAVAGLRERLAKELAGRRLQYTRSDGSTWTLTLADVVARKRSMEMAYNPNDCVEIRWAAPEGSKERATCKRHAPASQRARMDEYRPWFAERRRPPT